MPRKHRLSRTDLKTFRPQKRIDGALFGVAICKTSTSETSKVACVVSKKVATRAHERNLLRRRMKSVLYPYVNRAPIGFNVIVTAKKQAKSAPFDAIERDIAQIFDTLQVLPLMADTPATGYNVHK